MHEGLGVNDGKVQNYFFKETQSYLTAFIILQIALSGIFIITAFLVWSKDAFFMALLVDVSFVWLVLVVTMLSLRMMIRLDRKGISIRTGVFALEQRFIGWEDLHALQYIEIEKKDIPRLTRKKNHFICRGTVAVKLETLGGETTVLSLVDPFGFFCTVRKYFPLSRL